MTESRRSRKGSKIAPTRIDKLQDKQQCWGEVTVRFFFQNISNQFKTLLMAPNRVCLKRSLSAEVRVWQNEHLYCLRIAETHVLII